MKTSALASHLSPFLSVFRVPPGSQTDLLVVVLVALLAVLSIGLRGFMPYDETRYISIAWEMWRDHHWLIPVINGELYADKPPLLFWLVHAGWFVLGVNEWWPRSLPFIFALLNIFLARHIAGRLWPDSAGLRQAVPLVLLSLPVWFAYATPFMLDMLQTFFVLTAVCGLTLYRHRDMTGFIIFGIAAGLGMLLKGPVIFIYTLPLALTIPWWNERYLPGNRFFLASGIITGLFISFMIFAAWLLPVVHTLGMDQVRAAFLHQTADRMADVSAQAHSRTFWWYLPFLPLIFFPWAYRPSFWRSFLTGGNGTERKQWLFLMLWIVPAFLFLSIIATKKLHYLLPLLPPLVLGITRLLTDRDKTVHPADNRIAGFIFILCGLGFFLYRTFTAHTQNQWIDQLSLMLPVSTVAAGLLVICARPRDQYHAIKIMALGTLVFLFSAYTALLMAPRPFTRIDEISHMLASLQKNNVPLGHLGSHREQFEFAGRLTRPLDDIDATGLTDWTQLHPDGYVITQFNVSEMPAGLNPLYMQAYRFRQNLVLISSRDILDGKYTF